MSSCSCCLVENGHNIILEVVTATIAACFFVLDLWLSPTSFHMILADVGSIVVSVIGIITLKRQRNFRLPRATVHAATMVVGMYFAMAILFILGIYEIFDNPYHDMYDNIDMAINFAYLIFGFSTSIALAVKHWRINRTNVQNAITMTPGIMTVQYQSSVPKDQQQLWIEYHYGNPPLLQRGFNVHVNPQDPLMQQQQQHQQVDDPFKPPLYELSYAFPPGGHPPGPPPGQPPAAANCSYAPMDSRQNEPPPPYAKFALDTV